MTRAVIRLSGDISPVMGDLSKLIEGCAYSPEASSMAFRVEDTRVIVERNSITILDVEDEAKARAVTGWLIDLINGKATKQGVDIMARRTRKSLPRPGAADEKQD